MKVERRDGSRGNENGQFLWNFGRVGRPGRTDSAGNKRQW